MCPFLWPPRDFHSAKAPWGCPRAGNKACLVRPGEAGAGMEGQLSPPPPSPGPPLLLVGPWGRDCIGPLGCFSDSCNILSSEVTDEILLLEGILCR